jgi:hypothetical protein
VFVVSACGEGPAGDGGEDPAQGLPLVQQQQAEQASDQRPGSDYQRPVLDPQRVTSPDEQRLPGVSGELAGAPSCEELCADARTMDCGGSCSQACEAWRDAPARCFQLLTRLIDCVVTSSGECDTATEACLEQFQVEISECPDVSARGEED